MEKNCITMNIPRATVCSFLLCFVMVIHILISGIISCCFLIFCITGQRIVGSGTWSVVNLQQCENDAEMPWRLRGRRHKLNRSHDCFDAEVHVGALLDDTYGVVIEACKMVDGGCKHFMTIADDSLPNFVKKHADKNAKVIFESIGLDPPDFPLPPGDYRVENYLINMEEMHKQGVFGVFDGHVYVVKDGKNVACALITVKFEANEREDPVHTVLSPFG